MAKIYVPVATAISAGMAWWLGGYWGVFVVFMVSFAISYAFGSLVDRLFGGARSHG